MQPDASNQPENTGAHPPHPTLPQGWQDGFFVPPSGARRRPGVLTQLGALVLLVVPTVILMIFVLPLALLLLSIAVFAVGCLIARAWIIGWWRRRANPQHQRRNVRIRAADAATGDQPGSSTE